MATPSMDGEVTSARKSQTARKTQATPTPTPKKKWGDLGGGKGQNQAAWADVITSAAAASNTQGGGSWISMDGQTPAQPAYLNPKKPKVPAWMNVLANAAASANTGYNPQAPWISLAGGNRNGASPQPLQPPRGHLRPPTTQRQSPGVTNLVDVMPDGSVVPVVVPAMEQSQLPSNPEPIAAPTPRRPANWLPPMQQSYSPSFGFGTTYGGNWGGGGGGGGGGYGNPAWMDYLMNLYSWNIR